MTASLMMFLRSRRSRRSQRGNVLVIVAGGMVCLLGAGAWVVDLSTGLLDRTHMQAAADAGALAACYNLMPATLDERAAKAAAVDWTGRNGYTITTDDVTISTTPSGDKAATVRVTKTEPTTFARVLGIREYPVRVESTATLGGTTQIPAGFLPWGVPAYEDGKGNWYGLASAAPDVYERLTADPAKGGPTRILLKVSSGGASASAMTASSGLYSMLAEGAGRFFLLAAAGGNGNAGGNGGGNGGSTGGSGGNGGGSTGGSGGSSASNGGNFLALAIDGAGASVYRDTIVNGAQSPLEYGSTVSTETGNMVGPTIQGLSDRLARGPEYQEAYVPLIKKSEWDENKGRSTVTVIGFAVVKLFPGQKQGEVYAEFKEKVVPGNARVGEDRGLGAFSPILVPTPQQ
jgi:Flp pilus assembly protein TadG